jgi:hypothetical protein
LSIASEIEFQCALQDARRSSADDVSKRRASDVSVNGCRAGELVWLKTLKASMRKSSDFDSVIFKAFVSVMPRHSAPQIACKQL